MLATVLGFQRILGFVLETIFWLSLNVIFSFSVISSILKILFLCMLQEVLGFFTWVCLEKRSCMHVFESPWDFFFLKFVLECSWFLLSDVLEFPKNTLWGPWRNEQLKHMFECFKSLVVWKRGWTFFVKRNDIYILYI